MTRMNKEGRRKRKRRKRYSYIFPHAASLMRRWWGDRGARRDRNLLRTKPCVSSAALTVPAWLWTQSGGTGCSESLGFYNKMHHYPGNYSLHWVQTTDFLLLSWRSCSLVSISVLQLRPSTVKLLYCCTSLLFDCSRCGWEKLLHHKDQPHKMQFTQL